MKPANFAPVYACLYDKLAELTRSHGYALAAHGSLARDFDLVCIPWVEQPSQPQAVVDAITSTFSIVQVGEPEKRLHGRLVFTVSLSFGECFLDLSFMPTAAAYGAAPADACAVCHGDPYTCAADGCPKGAGQ